MPKKLFIQTYGCQMNQYDSEKIAQVLARQDYVRTDRIDGADVILLNTCSVRDKAEQKVYSALGSWKEFKNYRDGVIIGVGGCVAQQEGENLLKRIPHLDLVFGTHNIHKLPEMIEQVEISRARPVETAFYRDPAYMDDSELRTQVDGVKAFVTIMQGCNKVCSFCIVPHVRGREVSRPSAKILAEIESLARHGVKEVMLLGQNVNSYGKLTPGELSFAESARPGRPDRWLAAHSLYHFPPARFVARADRGFRHVGKIYASTCICRCSRVRTRSWRACAAVIPRRSILARLNRLRDRCPKVALSTDIIVGFPGETDGEFAETLELLRAVEYDDIYSFTYSPRPQTVSAKIYPDDVHDDVKKERLRIGAKIAARNIFGEKPPTHRRP